MLKSDLITPAFELSLEKVLPFAGMGGHKRTDRTRNDGDIFCRIDTPHEFLAQLEKDLIFPHQARVEHLLKNHMAYDINAISSRTVSFLALAWLKDGGKEIGKISRNIKEQA